MFDSYELNKIAGAILFSILIILGIGMLNDLVFDVETPEKPGYLVEVEATEEDTGHASEPAEPAASETSLAYILAGGDVAKGQKQAKKCAACHSFDDGGANKVGPNLYGIVGRDVASVSGFSYSSAMQGVDGNWSYELLISFLTKPKDAVPGTTMGFAGLKKPGQRADLIAYLRSISPGAPALPE